MGGPQIRPGETRQYRAAWAPNFWLARTPLKKFETTMLTIVTYKQSDSVFAVDQLTSLKY
jgi:hypothetical protein